MDHTYARGNMSSYNNSIIEDEIVDCIDNKVCVNETVISSESIKEELCGLGNEQGSIHSYINIKDEDIDDLVIVTQGTEHMNNCTDDKVCVNKTVISSESVKEEPYDWGNEQESIHSYLSIKDENIDDLTVVTEEIKLMNDCIDNKICETIISGGSIKEEPCDLGNDQGSIHSYINIKDEDIGDLTVVRPDTELINDCTDDKVCANETVNSDVSIKEKPCDLESVYSYINIKDENIDDLTVVRQETELINDCPYNKGCVNETILGREFIKEEPNDLRSEQGSIHTYINTKDEDIDDLMVVTQDTNVMNDCTEDRVCINKTVRSGGSIKEKPCDLGNEQESIYNYINIKDKNIDDLTVVTRETELCADDKVCRNKTVIGEEYIKQKPCGMEDDQGLIHNYVNIKDENIDELIFIVVQETEPTTNLKVVKNVVRNTIYIVGNVLCCSALSIATIQMGNITQLSEHYQKIL